MKILTADEMREVDRRTIERGIPGIILMENAGIAVVDYLRRNFAPLSNHRVIVFCGKGNNGGDGFVVARQLFQHRLCDKLTVIEAFPAAELKGDAATARKMLDAIGCPVSSSLEAGDYSATVVIDAVLGTGVTGSASGRALEFIQAINQRFPHAIKVAVDIPSGLPTDETAPTGEYVHTDHTVTFTALKRSQVLSPSYEAMGRLSVHAIGTADELCELSQDYRLRLTTVDDISSLFVPRRKDSNKGLYGHVLVVGGSAAKPGAPAMAGISVLKAGAGLVTVASARDAISSIASLSPELMTEPLPQDASGFIDQSAQQALESLSRRKTVVAIGPGLGTEPGTVALVQHLYKNLEVPAVLDADGLNALAGTDVRTNQIRILTPHPGEMSRLIGKSVKEVQASRLDSARQLATDTGACIVLKGDRTVIAFPDGDTWINPTGSPALATGGTGDILTGMIAGLIAQHPDDWKRAVVAGVWLHGRAGELGAEAMGEQSFLATDVLHYLPQAMKECRAGSHHPER